MIIRRASASVALALLFAAALPACDDPPSRPASGTPVIAPPPAPAPEPATTEVAEEPTAPQAPPFSALRAGATWRLSCTATDLNEGTEERYRLTATVVGGGPLPEGGRSVRFRWTEDSAEGGSPMLPEFARIGPSGLQIVGLTEGLIPPRFSDLPERGARVHRRGELGCVRAGYSDSFTLCFDRDGVPRTVSVEGTMGESHCWGAFPVGLPIRTYEASRFLTEGRTRHRPRRAFDGRRETAWAARDPVDGDWVEGCTPRPRAISAVTLTTGFDWQGSSGLDLFVANARLRRVTVELRDADATVLASSTAVVEATQRELTVPFDGVTAACVRVIAHETWPGERWQDLSISEISLLPTHDG